MMKVDVRFAPIDEPQTLAWATETLAAVKTIHDFVLDSTVRQEVFDTNARQLSPDALETVVQGRILEIGTPFIRMRDGSLILELSHFVDATVPVQVLVGLTVLLKRGPEAVALPQHIRKAWYESSADATEAQQRALKARQAYERLRANTDVEVMEDHPEGAGQDDVDAATSGPATARQTVARRRRTRQGSADS